jgi:hypothetical protein
LLFVLALRIVAAVFAAMAAAVAMANLLPVTLAVNMDMPR